MKMLTCLDVAEFYGIRPTSVANLARTGKIKAQKNSDGEWMIDEQSANKWFESGKSKKLREGRIAKNKVQLEIRPGIGNLIYSFIKNWDGRKPSFTLDEIVKGFNQNNSDCVTREQMSSLLCRLVNNKLIQRVQKGCYKLIESENEIIYRPEIKNERNRDSTSNVASSNLSKIKEITNSNLSESIKLELIQKLIIE